VKLSTGIKNGVTEEANEKKVGHVLGKE